jgi:hypothetical protein
VKKEGISGTKIQYEGRIDELKNILENGGRERYLETKNPLVKTRGNKYDYFISNREQKLISRYLREN